MQEIMPRSTPTRKPRIILLVDKPNWAFDFSAKSIAKRLSHRYDFSIRYVRDAPDLAAEWFDLLYVFFWGDAYHKQFSIDPKRIIKEVASHRWEERLSTSQFIEQYLSDCAYVTTPSRRLYAMLQPLRPHVYHCPNAVEHDLFRLLRTRTGPLRIGWVGNPKDASKGLHDILVPACSGRFRFSYANGKWTRRQLVKFYNNIDVLAIASSAEGEPLPLMEAMACGCFPVSTNVGIVPELINSGFNGLVVERSSEAFREAFAWCERNLTQIRRVGPYNAATCVAMRSWEKLLHNFSIVLDHALGLQTSEELISETDAIDLDTNSTVEVVPLRSYSNQPEEFTASSMDFNAGDEQSYLTSVTSYENLLRPLLPTNRDSSILVLGNEYTYLVRFLLELGYLHKGLASLPNRMIEQFADYLGVAQGFIRRAHDCESLSWKLNNIDAVIISGGISHLSVDKQHELARVIFSALKRRGRVILEILNGSNSLEGDASDLQGQCDANWFSLFELLQTVGFHNPGMVKFTRNGTGQKLNLLRRLLHRSFKRQELSISSRLRRDVVVWAEKSSA